LVLRIYWLILIGLVVRSLLLVVRLVLLGLIHLIIGLIIVLNRCILSRSIILVIVVMMVMSLNCLNRVNKLGLDILRLNKCRLNISRLHKSRLNHRLLDRNNLRLIDNAYLLFNGIVFNSFLYSFNWNVLSIGVIMDLRNIFSLIFDGIVVSD